MKFAAVVLVAAGLAVVVESQDSLGPPSDRSLKKAKGGKDKGKPPKKKKGAKGVKEEEEKKKKEKKEKEPKGKAKKKEKEEDMPKKQQPKKGKKMKRAKKKKGEDGGKKDKLNKGETLAPVAKPTQKPVADLVPPTPTPVNPTEPPTTEGECLKEITLGNIRPEGISAGPDEVTIYTSQFAYGGVLEVNVMTGESKQLVPAQETFLSRGALGIHYTDGALLVAGGGPAIIQSNSSEFFAYDATTGDELAHCYPETGTGFINDVTVKDGKAYFTDSFLPSLTVMNVPEMLNGNCDLVETIPLDDSFRSEEGEFLGNGIASYADGVVMTQSATGSVWYLNLMDHNMTQIVADDTIPGADGVEVKDGIMYVTSNVLDHISVWKLRGGNVATPMVTANYKGFLKDPLMREQSPTASALVSNCIYTVLGRFEEVPFPAVNEGDLEDFSEEFKVVGLNNTYYVM